MIRFESLTPEQIAEYEAEHWYDGIALFVLIPLLVLVMWALS